MNRAWIPAGALAGLSVAGLLALAPLTDSLGTQVKFEPSVPVSSSLSKPLNVSVPVSVNLRTVGTTSTAALIRGGQAAKLSTSSDVGLVGAHVKPKTTTAAATPTETKTAAKPEPKTESDIKPPKTVERQDSIGGDTGPNSDKGLAGGNDTTTGVGEQSNTPAG